MQKKRNENENENYMNKSGRAAETLTKAVKMPRTVIPTIGATCTLTPGSMYKCPVRSTCKSLCNVYGLSVCRSHFSPTIRSSLSSVNDCFVCVVALPLSISFWMLLSHLANTKQNNSNPNCTWQPPITLLAHRNVRRGDDFLRDLFIVFASRRIRFIGEEEEEWWLFFSQFVTSFSHDMIYLVVCRTRFTLSALLSACSYRFQFET